jgi:hypothetical protein
LALIIHARAILRSLLIRNRTCRHNATADDSDCLHCFQRPHPHQFSSSWKGGCQRDQWHHLPPSCPTNRQARGRSPVTSTCGPGGAFSWAVRVVDCRYLIAHTPGAGAVTGPWLLPFFLAARSLGLGFFCRFRCTGRRITDTGTSTARCGNPGLGAQRGFSFLYGRCETRPVQNHPRLSFLITFLLIAVVDGRVL